jgi:hypothetical protein
MSTENDLSVSLLLRGLGCITIPIIIVIIVIAFIVGWTMKG